MLGDTDDLASVLSVLDRLSSELEKNRGFLDIACANADELGHDHIEPSEINADTLEELPIKLRQKTVNCQALRIALEDIMTNVSVAAELARKIEAVHSNKELRIHKVAQKKLLTLQNKTEKISDQYLRLRILECEIDRVLVRLYGDLKAKVG